MNSKIETYIGFAIKKGAAVFGVDNIVRYRKKMYLLVVTESISERSLVAMEECAQAKGLPIATVQDYPLLAQRNCKALAICDKSLADAVLNNVK